MVDQVADQKKRRRGESRQHHLPMRGDGARGSECTPDQQHGRGGVQHGVNRGQIAERIMTLLCQHLFDVAQQLRDGIVVRVP